MKKVVLYCALALGLSACSGTNIIEKSSYVSSDTLPALVVPADMQFVELKPAYPVPAVEGSIKGKTPAELEQLKSPPNLLK